jgi:hypothetical protein
MEPSAIAVTWSHIWFSRLSWTISRTDVLSVIHATH